MNRLLPFLLLLFLLPVACGVSKKPAQPVSTGIRTSEFSLDEIQRRSFLYFWETTDTFLYQVQDRWPTKQFSSIAATGFGLSCYLVGAERGWITRKQAIERVQKTLMVLQSLPQGPAAKGVSGYKGFFYHFLDNKKGHRYEKIELSSIDTGLLMAGILSVMSYFDKNDPAEKYIRETADALFRRVEWDWFMNKNGSMSMGWFPDRGFLSAEWSGYNEAMVLLIMAMGSPTHPINDVAWKHWCKRYLRAEYRGQDMVNFGPLFGHQYSHCWIDFRGIKDDYMRKMGIDYFENSRRATLANHDYCVENPKKWKGYGPKMWGLTAADGPGYTQKMYNGQMVDFHGYSARGVAFDYDVDDGTIVPTAAGGSMPFAPDICTSALQGIWERWGLEQYGFRDSYNESYPNADGSMGWKDIDYLGIDQGPMVLMIENHRSAFLWDLMKKNRYIVAGLLKAGFKGGWLDNFQTAMPAFPNNAQPNPDIPLPNEGFFRREIFASKTGQKMPFQLAEPAKIEKNQQYPLVILLHGSGERGFDNASHMKNGVYAFVENSVREKHPHYLLVPQCPENDVWGGVDADWNIAFNDKTFSKSGKIVLEMIDKMLLENPNIDPKRIYITGLSMGGFGTFDLMMRQPDLFAAGMPLCGAGDPTAATRIKDIPIWAFHGLMDDAVYPQNDQAMIEALKKAGSKVKYTEFTSKSHDIWEIVYYNPAVLDWLFEQKK